MSAITADDVRVALAAILDRPDVLDIVANAVNNERDDVIEAALVAFVVRAAAERSTPR